jgi:hypothetical protein
LTLPDACPDSGLGPGLVAFADGQLIVLSEWSEERVAEYVAEYVDFGEKAINKRTPFEMGMQTFGIR